MHTVQNFFKKINYKIACIVLLGVLTACIVLALVFIRPTYRQHFVITGDVCETVQIDSLDGWATETAYRDGRAYQSLNLSKLIAKAKPYASEYKVVLKGDDSLLAEVDNTDGICIAYTAENAWECINENHPLSSNIKRLSEVWVVAEEDVSQYSVHIISADKNIASFTPGQFFMSERQTAPVFEGQSEKTAEKGKYSVTVYTQRQYKNILDIAPDAGQLLIMGDEGQYQFDSSAGRLELNGNTLQYVFSDGKTRMKNVRGILVNPPVASNLDAYHESLNNLKNGSRVLVVLLDGFSYQQYMYAKENGFISYLSSLPKAKQASTVYMPVTYAGTAAILTGEPPYKNGVYKTNMPDLKTDDIFKTVSDMGKTSAYIEGNLKLLNTSLEPVLNADRNQDKSTDSEVFESAEKALLSAADFLFVHFHGIDDQGHTYGDINEKVMQKVKEIDGYLKLLIENFHGRVILTADHGMHKTADGGSHGVFQYEDMIIAYISFFQK